MQKNQQAQFPIIAALLSLKGFNMLKEKRDGMIQVRGHESMRVGMDLLSNRLHIFVEGTDIEFEIFDEAQALVKFYSLTWESTPEYAREWLHKTLPQFAAKF